MEYIRSEVIPAINLHASSTITNWKPVTLSEYLALIGLFIVMPIIKIADKAAYWRKSAFPFGPSVDFTTWMEMERFEGNCENARLHRPRCHCLC